MIACGECNYAMCFKDQVSWHIGQTCEEYAMEQMEPGAKESLEYIAKNTKRCPMCSVNIEKGEWCFHMTCEFSAPRPVLPRGRAGPASTQLTDKPARPSRRLAVRSRVLLGVSHQLEYHRPPRPAGQQGRPRPGLLVP